MRVVVLFISLLFVNMTFAQSFEEKFRAFQKEAQKEYQSFRENANKQYADFLRGAWEYYNSMPEIPMPEEEPIPPIIYNDEQEKKEEELVVIEDPIIVPSPEPKPEPIEPVNPVPEPIEKKCKFSFFNTSCEVNIPEQLFELTGVDNESLATGWEVLSNG